MSDDRAQAIHDDLIDGLAHEFTPSVKVQECMVVSDYEQNTYWIKIRGYCPFLQVSIYDKLGIKPLV